MVFFFKLQLSCLRNNFKWPGIQTPNDLKGLVRIVMHFVSKNRFVCDGAQVSRRRRRVRRGRSRTWLGRSPPPPSSLTLTRPSYTSQSPGSTGRPTWSYLRLFICLVDRGLLAISPSFSAFFTLVIWFPGFNISFVSNRDSVSRWKIFEGF